MALFVGLDVGTQGAKAVVYDSNKRAVVSRGAFAYSVLPTDVPGRAEQHPSLWIEGGTAAISDALSTVDRKNVKAIGISGQQHGFVPLDEHGKVIRNAKLWCDVESTAQATALSKEWDWTLVPGFSASKILWLKENEPDNFARLRHVLLPHDYFNYFLTGTMVMEYGDASGTGVFDTANRTFDTARMELIDPALPSFFPPLVKPDVVIGTLLPEVAERLGLSPEVAVSAGSGDNQMAALGAGAVREGTFVMSLGTSGTLFGVSGKPVLDPTGNIAPFCDATGQWMPLLCTQNCTTVTEEARKAFKMEHSEIMPLAEAEAAGSRGVNFLPYLTGERTPNWPNSSGALIGLRADYLRPGVVYRAAMEGATFALLNGLKMLEGFGVSASEIRVVGGGSKSRLWRRIIADSFQLPLRFPTEPEAAALGAALQAAAAFNGVAVKDYASDNQPPLSDEVVEPNPAVHESYLDAFGRHQDLSQKLFGSS